MNGHGPTGHSSWLEVDRREHRGDVIGGEQGLRALLEQAPAATGMAQA